MKVIQYDGIYLMVYFTCPPNFQYLKERCLILASILNHLPNNARKSCKSGEKRNAKVVLLSCNIVCIPCFMLCVWRGRGGWRWKVMADLTTIYSCPSKLICEVATLPHETRMIWVELVFLLSKEGSWKQWISSSLSCHKITRKSNTHSYENTSIQTYIAESNVWCLHMTGITGAICFCSRNVQLYQGDKYPRAEFGEAATENQLPKKLLYI